MQLFLEILGVNKGAKAIIGDTVKDLDGLGKKSSSNFDKLAKVGGAAFKAVAVGGLAVAVATTHMAADFQQSTSRIVTDGGESAGALKQVQDGILGLMGQVGDSAPQLVDAMNTIESAGFHAAQGGLDVLKVAAEGAKVGNAELQVTANALTSALNAYGLSAKDSTSVMNQMIATVAAGKMHMQDLASSLSNVLPIAAAAHISFAQVGGAIATMTAQGMSAQQATQDLANTIRSLQNPNGTAIKEMTALGLNSNQVADSLGKKGLTGTLDDLTSAIAKHVKSGDVFISSLKSSKIAAADLQTMMKQLPASVQRTAQAFLNGQLSQKQWTASLKGLPPLQANLAKQFATTAKQANGFNDLLKSGTPAAQTMNAALGDMLGGATGLNTALMISGAHMATFKGNVDSIASSGKDASGQVKDWATVQKNFNQQLDVAKAQVEALGIKIGTALLPWAEKLLHATMDLVHWFGQHKSAAEALGAVIAGVLSVAIGAYFLKLGKGLLDNAKNLVKFGGDAVKTFRTVGGAIASGAGKIGDLASAAKSGFDTVALKSMYAKDKIVELAASGWSKLATFASNIAEWASSAASAMASAGKAVAAYAVKLGEMAVEAATSFASMAADAAVWAGEMLVAGFEAMLPFLPIIAALAAVAAAAYLLYRYWDKIWGFIRDSAVAAWHFLDNDVIHPLVHLGIWWIKTEIQILEKTWSAIWTGLKDAALAVLHVLDGDVIHPLVHLGIWFVRAEIQTFERLWSDAWNGAKDAALAVWHILDGDVLRPIVRDGIGPVRDGISELKRIWDEAWAEVRKIVQAVWGDISPIFNSIENAVGTVTGLLNGLTGVSSGGSLGSGLSKTLASIPHRKDGGWVPGPKGAPTLVMAHGGEYVLSTDMLEGRVPTAGAGGAAGGGTTIIVQAAGSILTMSDIYQELRTLFFQDGRRLPATWPSTSTT
jgi:hypothetical protein